MKIYNREDFMKLPEGVIYFNFYKFSEECKYFYPNKKLLIKGRQVDEWNITAVELLDIDYERTARNLSEKKIETKELIDYCNRNSDSFLIWNIFGPFEHVEELHDVELFFVLEKSDWEKIKNLVEKAYE